MKVLCACILLLALELRLGESGELRPYHSLKRLGYAGGAAIERVWGGITTRTLSVNINMAPLQDTMTYFGVEMNITHNTRMISERTPDHTMELPGPYVLPLDSLKKYVNDLHDLDQPILRTKMIALSTNALDCRKEWTVGMMHEVEQALADINLFYSVPSFGSLTCRTLHILIHSVDEHATLPLCNEVEGSGQFHLGVLQFTFLYNTTLSRPHFFVQPFPLRMLKGEVILPCFTPGIYEQVDNRFVASFQQKQRDADCITSLSQNKTHHCLLVPYYQTVAMLQNQNKTAILVFNNSNLTRLAVRCSKKSRPSWFYLETGLFELKLETECTLISSNASFTSTSLALEDSFWDAPAMSSPFKSEFTASIIFIALAPIILLVMVLMFVFHRQVASQCGQVLLN